MSNSEQQNITSVFDVPETIELESLPYYVDTDIPGQKKLVEKTKKILNNPFNNMFDMVRCYFDIFKSKNHEKLKDFLNTSPDNYFGISFYDMYFFLIQIFGNSKNPMKNSRWMKFDENALKTLLADEFFDEYNSTVGKISEEYNRDYPLVEYYAYVKLQSFAATVLPQSDSWDINTFWIMEDNIECIFQFGWYKIIATVYKSMGRHWFCYTNGVDPVPYKWACLAIISCKRSEMVDRETLKYDLSTMYKELIIALAAHGSLDKNQEIIDYVQNCINNFDSETLNSLVGKINQLQAENEQLLNERAVLNDGMRILREQIQELQQSADNPGFDKIEEIAYKINYLSPQNDDLDDKVKQFQIIWNKLDKTTKKDIKLSVVMFERFDSFDLAMFPMIRSLEHEISQNIFIPFYQSKEYKNAGKPYCNSNYYLKTHEALIKKTKSHPTLGNISFIGKAINDVKALKSSNIINAFAAFLGAKKQIFSDICKLIDSYRIGIEKFRLVELRNGIAHGDDNITTNIDKSCYEDVRKVLYEPPFEILFKVVNNSFRD